MSGNRAHLIGGIVCSFTALIVFYGWFITDKSLIQITENFAPMQFNTALGLFLLGSGLLILDIKNGIIARVLGALAFIIGGATFLQYIFGIDLKIDNFFVDGSAVITNVTHVGRMAPNTAICYILSGFSLYFLNKPKVAFGFAFSVLFLSLVALLGYLVGDPKSYIYVTITRMAIHTSLGFFLFSTFFLFYLKTNKDQELWDLSPYITFLSLFFVTIYAWHTSNEFELNQYENEFRNVVLGKEKLIHRGIDSYKQTIKGAVAFYNASEEVEKDEWQRYTKSYGIESLPGIIGIGFLEYLEDDKVIIKYSEPEDLNHEVIGSEISINSELQEHIKGSSESLEMDMRIMPPSGFEKDSDSTRLFIFAPLYKKREASDKIYGWVYADISIENFMDSIVRRKLDLISYEVYEVSSDEKVLIHQKNLERQAANKFGISFESSLEISGKLLNVVWKPTDKFANKLKSDSGIIFSVGMFVTLLVTLILYFLARSYNRTAKVAQDSEAFNKMIIESAVDGFVVATNRGIIKKVNSACERMFGYTSKEMVGSNLNMLMPEPYHSEHKGYLKKYSKTGEKKIIGIGREVSGKKKDGTVFPVYLSVSEMEIDGEILFNGSLRDLTERDKLIDYLTRSNEQLERFAYVCSHDLQEPFRMVKSFSEKVATHLEDKLVDDEIGKQYLDFVIDGAKRAQNLISGILEYSRLDNDVGTREKIDTNSLLDSIIKDMKLTIEDSGASIEVGRLPKINGNKTQIYQLFQNLINNSIKYKKDDVAPEITICGEKEKDQVVFSISDNGIGMAEKNLYKIFNVFQRLHGRKKYPGTGIGLSLCKKIVEKHGGQIWVESELGVGSTFYFTIK